MRPFGKPYGGRRSWKSSKGGRERCVWKRRDRERRRREIEAMEEGVEAMGEETEAVPERREVNLERVRRVKTEEDFVLFCFVMFFFFIYSIMMGKMGRNGTGRNETEVWVGFEEGEG